MSGEGRDTLEHREELLLRHQLDAEALRVLVGLGALDGPPVAQAVTDNHVGHALVDPRHDGPAGGRDAWARAASRDCGFSGSGNGLVAGCQNGSGSKLSLARTYRPRVIGARAWVVHWA